MVQLLLIIIYLAFISLGLPDSLLGSAWPSMYTQLDVPIAYAGIISMLIAGGTIISSLLSDRLLQKAGTGLVTAISVAMTAIAMMGFSVSGSFFQLCLWSIPYGLGAGSVDATLNNFVALNYKSRHMSWLHCFWGIGATLGPFIMGICLTGGFLWNTGYRVIGWIQMILVICLFVSLPLWRGKKGDGGQGQPVHQSLSMKEVLCLPGAKAVLTAFFCYCALEATAGLWASSYLVIVRGLPVQTAAKWASFFYLGITLGRFVCGMVTDQFGDIVMVRCGQFLVMAGTLLLLLPLGDGISLTGLIMLGLGCAPIYPSLLHETPNNFGAVHSQSLMGIQMACAYVGSTLMPPLFGFLAEHISVRLYPLFLMILMILMFINVERMNKIHGKFTY